MDHKDESFVGSNSGFDSSPDSPTQGSSSSDNQLRASASITRDGSMLSYDAESSGLDETFSTSISMAGMDRMDANSKVTNSSDDQDSDSDYSMSMEDDPTPNETQQNQEASDSFVFEPARSAGNLATNMPMLSDIQPIQPFSFVVQTSDGPQQIELAPNYDENISSSPRRISPDQISPISPGSNSSSISLEDTPIENDASPIPSPPDSPSSHSAPIDPSATAGLESQADIETTNSHDEYEAYQSDSDSDSASKSSTSISQPLSDSEVPEDATSLHYTSPLRVNIEVASEESDQDEMEVPSTPAMLAPPMTPHVPLSVPEDPEFLMPASPNSLQNAPSSSALIDIGIPDDSGSEPSESESESDSSESSSSGETASDNDEEEVIEEEVPELSRSQGKIVEFVSSEEIEVLDPSGVDTATMVELERMPHGQKPSVSFSEPSGPRLQHSRRGAMLLAPSSATLPRQQMEVTMESNDGSPANYGESFVVATQKPPQYANQAAPSSAYALAQRAPANPQSNPFIASSSAPNLRADLSRAPMTSNQHLRMNVPSQAEFLMQELFRRRTTKRMSVLHTSVSISEFAPLQRHNQVPKPQYGPFIQPPLQGVMPWRLPEGTSYQYLYTHPMDVEPSDDGSFPEDAPRATLLTNRGLQFLLPTLTALDLSYNTTITGACFASLPPSMHYLDLRNITQVSDSDLKNLPRMLQYLNLRRAARLTNSDIDRLPKTLTHLTLSGEHPNFTCSVFAKLPRHLRTLRIAGLTKITKASTEDLPSTLQRLEMPKLVVMRDKCITKLPRSLTHLHIGTVSTIAAAMLIHLPPRLQYLNITCMFLNTAADLQLLPVGINHLTCTAFAFSCEGHFTNLTVLHLIGAVNETISLPNTITALKYSTNLPPTSPAAFAQVLPLRLKFLVARGFAWDDETIAKLPSGLVWLSLDASQLTSNCFASMQRQLEYIRLQAMRLFRPEALQFLPPTTKYLHLDPHLHNKMLMKHCPLYLPQWEGGCDLATLEDVLFGREYEIMDEKHIFDDPNMWTAMGQRELDSHGLALNPLDNSVIHGAGFLFPIEHMNTPYAWSGLPKFKVKKSRKAAPDPFDPAQPSFSPLDLHLAARTATRRSLIPLPSESVRRFEADIMNPDLAALDPTTTDLSAPGARSVSSVGVRQMPTHLNFLDMRNLINLTSSKDLARVFKHRSQLTTINLESNPFNGTSGLKCKLPKTLVALDLSNSDLGGDLVKRLPHSMTFLALGCTKLSTNLPTSLTALYLGNLHRVETSFVSKLPRTLVYLDLYSAMEVEEGAIDSLPKHALRYLNLHNLKSLPETCFSRFPRHLRYLSISEVKGITDKGIEALPRALKHLDISSAQLTAQGIASLPSGLTHLSVGTDHGHDRLECIAYLPRSLTILNYGGDLYDSWFSFLPPFLVFLNLPFAVSMSPSFVKNLPNQLLYLGVHSWARQLLAYPFSTPNLLHLDVYNADVTQTPLEALPMSLQYICSSNTAFRTECSKQLPNFDVAEITGANLLQTIFHDVDIDE